MDPNKFPSLKPEDVAKLSEKDRTAYIVWLTNERDALKAKVDAAPSFGRITMKVAVKGGLSVYGLAKTPVTLYKEQWLKLLDGNKGAEADSTFADLLEALNNPELSTGKDDKRYQGEALKQREAEFAAKKAARSDANNTTPSQDMRPRLAPQA